MKILDNIPSTSIVSIDIETVRISEDFNEMDEQYQSAWEYKNKQDGEIPDPMELANFWTRRSSLYAEFSKICAVSLCFLSEGGDKLMCKEIFGEDEPQILEELANFLDRIDSASKYRLAGHAAKYFDYPFICKRYIINGMRIPNILDTSAMKPWEQKNLCTNELWKMGGTGPGSSLQALCVALNIPISKVDMVGDEVGKHYYDGNIPQVGRYCSYDAIATFNVIRRYKGEPIFQFDEVAYVEQKEFKKAPLLERLSKSDSFDDKMQEDVKKLVGKKRLTKVDKESLKNILLSVHQQKGDKKADKQRKEEEVNKFINTL